MVQFSTIDEAIRFCEDHECYECPVLVEGDKRTEDEKWSHTPCCMNLVSREEWGKYGL